MAYFHAVHLTTRLLNTSLRTVPRVAAGDGHDPESFTEAARSPTPYGTTMSATGAEPVSNSAMETVSVFWVTGSRQLLGPTLHAGPNPGEHSISIPLCGRTLTTAPVITARDISYPSALEEMTTTTAYEACPKCVDTLGILSAPTTLDFDSPPTYWLSGNLRQKVHVARTGPAWPTTLCGAPGAAIRSTVVGASGDSLETTSPAVIVTALEKHPNPYSVCPACEAAIRSAAGGELPAV